MSMIFPGMDPYLEEPALWPNFHNSLAVHIRDLLQPRLRPNYVATVEERVYVEQPDEPEFVPDVLLKKQRAPRPGGGAALLEADEPIIVRGIGPEVRENYVEIRDRRSGLRVVTVIEIVSPTNKYAGRGRDEYLSKQAEVRRSTAHLVEIDLLRYGPHVLVVPELLAQGQAAYDYLVCVNRADRRTEYALYPIRLRERLARVRLPLAGDDPDVVLDLAATLAHTYELGGYRDLIRYDRPCVPLLSPEDQAWADGLIRQANAAASQ
jgi:Protein of unknown function (DUF4058)